MSEEKHYEFGANWAGFINQHYSEERLNQAKKAMLGFLGMSNLNGRRFLDIGSGSGLHSLAAFKAGAQEVASFDYDADSVNTTAALRKLADEPSNWSVRRGDVLSDDFMNSLGTWDIVYSWGVLHHTGDLWKAITNAQARVADNGLFFIALYSSDVARPSTQYWLDIKKRYNASGGFQRRLMEYWYVLRHELGLRPWRVATLVKQISDKKKSRGMDYMTDVRDWLGGWPMQYAGDQEVVDLLEGKFGFQLINLSTGEACTEFLFCKASATRQEITNVKNFKPRTA